MGSHPLVDSGVDSGSDVDGTLDMVLDSDVLSGGGGVSDGIMEKLRIVVSGVGVGAIDVLTSSGRHSESVSVPFCALDKRVPSLALMRSHDAWTLF